MTPDVIVALAAAVLGSSTLVALINWRKDRGTDAAQAEALSTSSLHEALVAVRGELQAVRAELAETKAELAETKAELAETKRALDEALVTLAKYRQPE